MKRLQKTLIVAKSVVDKSGLLNFRISQTLYWKVYRVYKKRYEGRSFTRIIRFLSMSLMSNRFRLIIDVGAHVGSSTDLMNQYFPNSTIIAFEPDPRNNDLFGYFLSHRITAGDVVLMKQAVWSSSGEIPFDFQPSNTADNKFDPESALKVPCVSIDDYIFREGFEVDLIKVDVQGYELEVIQGAIVTIQKYKPLLILELDYDALDARGHSENDLLELLWKLDYRVINPLDGNTLTETQVRNLMTVERCLDLLLAPLSHEASQEDPK